MTYVIRLMNRTNTKSEIYTISDALGMPHAEVWAAHRASYLAGGYDGRGGEVWWVYSIVNPNDKSDFVFKSHPDRIPPVIIEERKLISHPEGIQ